MQKILSILTALIFAAGVLGAAVTGLALYTPNNLPAPQLVYIAPGTPTTAIGQQLYDSHLITEPFFFKVGAYIARSTGPLKAGEYEIPAHSRIVDIIRLFQSGKTYQRRITFAEGLTAVEIVALINQTEKMSGNIEQIPPEGTLMPETYSYTYNEDRQKLLQRMQVSMTETLQALWPGRSPDVPLASPAEAVILASIVEKETGVASERPRVAGVFINRLKIGMPLQSDPTVIYAVTGGKEKLNRAISRKDLNTASPYNTYLNKGLTPTPIANPGKASLEAVLHPESHGYLYFVADGTGGHAFATSLDEHTKNVAKWRIIEKQRQQ